MGQPQNEFAAPQATLAQSPVVEPPAYYAAPATNPAAQGEIQQVAYQQPQQPHQEIQQQQQQTQPLPANYTTKQAEAMNPNGVPLVTPLEMLQGETPQYIDCPWCYQRALATAQRHGTSMQMYVPRFISSL
jgi:hypothetical protein